MTYIQPLCPLSVLISLIGLIVLVRRSEPRMLIGGLIILSVLLWPPTDWLFSRPLETSYPIRPLPPGPADAIVVPAAGVSPPHYERPYALPDPDTFERCEFAIWLYQHWRPLPILVSGGQGAAGEPFTASMRELLKQSGIPEGMIWTEGQSHSTYENAVFSSGILRRHGINRIALVVDAQSMPRAAACFRKQGIYVVPAPSRFTQLDWRSDLLPNWAALEKNELTAHESLGFIYYWLRGWL
jgi:uncharacterized SAM-binding protein YcdF (DUF218 family)